MYQAHHNSQILQTPDITDLLKDPEDLSHTPCSLKSLLSGLSFDFRESLARSSSTRPTGHSDAFAQRSGLEGSARKGSHNGGIGDGWGTLFEEKKGSDDDVLEESVAASFAQLTTRDGQKNATQRSPADFVPNVTSKPGSSNNTASKNSFTRAHSKGGEENPLEMFTLARVGVHRISESICNQVVFSAICLKAAHDDLLATGPTVTNGLSLMGKESNSSPLSHAATAVEIDGVVRAHTLQRTESLQRLSSKCDNKQQQPPLPTDSINTTTADSTHNIAAPTPPQRKPFQIGFVLPDLFPESGEHLCKLLLRSLVDTLKLIPPQDCIVFTRNIHFVDDLIEWLEEQREERMELGPDGDDLARSRGGDGEKWKKGDVEKENEAIEWNRIMIYREISEMEPTLLPSLIIVTTPSIHLPFMEQFLRSFPKRGTSTPFDSPTRPTAHPLTTKDQTNVSDSSLPYPSLFMVAATGVTRQRVEQLFKGWIALQPYFDFEKRAGDERVDQRVLWDTDRISRGPVLPDLDLLRQSVSQYCEALNPFEKANRIEKIVSKAVPRTVVEG
ncbi:hypothetical protein HK102_013204 [Quaeritorhiza haematococci]|nr:hypothetical protein HK102_013204 [Quaeritorhiza haematococci]